PDSPELDPSYYDLEGDIQMLEAILNSDPAPSLLNHEQSVPSFTNELKACEAKTIKSSANEPPKDLGLKFVKTGNRNAKRNVNERIIEFKALELYKFFPRKTKGSGLCWGKWWRSWVRCGIQMLMQGTSLTKQERECKLYDEFDKFVYKKGESLCDFYLRFLLLLNIMNIYNMELEHFQVNTKFLNTLPPEWSKFVTDVKLVRDLHTTNVDQLHAYLGQHEYHTNEYASQAQSSTPLSITYPSNDFQSSVNHNVYNPSSSIPQVKYPPTVHQQSDFS
nr:integrase, catalytic region, zinc finger, CCHC-type, peptidase aspartic, catalytic [Tanacetum cinerariifolium]